ncbi:MAG: alpha-N-arabinofuranosidase [Cephaloticoccus sp.]|nr:alpha-N-arabinofuranosidase [Cephaloticoccus sp.]MCF7761909.1 alpha-N-arabinofuranosidase [Cephaloticoccus sp.]
MNHRAQLHIAADQPGPVISRHLFGHFAEHLGRCIYDGLWVGEDSPVPNVRGWRSDLVAALRAIKIPNLRWPGGCYADDYYWRDGIGPRQQRPRRVNAHWGGVLDDNAVGTHEFLDLCEQLGCAPYIALNLGSGSPREMREWVEYVNAPAGTLAEERAANGRKAPWSVTLWGVGNENWGCGGHMRPEYYADEYRRYATYVQDYPGAKPLRMACGPNEDDYNWTEVMMRECAKPLYGFDPMNGLSLHYYTLPGGWANKAPATPFDHSGWNEVMARGWRMDELVRQHSAIMDRSDPEKKVALLVDEWGAWYDVEAGTNPRFLYQQQTVRDAVLAALNLNIFIANCERVRFANLAQVVNVLQSIALTEPDGGRMVLTPTWDVFKLYAGHHESRRLPVQVVTEQLALADMKFPQVSATASLTADGAVNVTLCNTDPAHAVEIALTLAGHSADQLSAHVLSSPELTTCNTFDQPRAVTTHELTGIKISGHVVTATIPAGAVASLHFA